MGYLSAEIDFGMITSAEVGRRLAVDRP